jgi:hypothetical protein
MISRKVKMMIGALAVTAVVGMGIGVNTYAEVTSADDNTNTVVCDYGMRRNPGERGGFFRSSTVVDKLNLTSEEITQLRNGEKTLEEIAKEKNIDLDAVKAEVLEERYKLIDEAVENDQITEEQAELMKERMKSNINNCDGMFNGERQNGFGNFNGDGKGRGNGNSRGRGNGRGRCNLGN